MLKSTSFIYIFIKTFRNKDWNIRWKAHFSSIKTRFAKPLVVKMDKTPVAKLEVSGSNPGEGSFIFYNIIPKGANSCHPKTKNFK